MGLFDFFKKEEPVKVFGKEVNIEALALITAGDNSYDNDDFQTAIKHYTKAIELDSKNRYSFLKRGQCYKSIQLYDKAIEDFFKSKSFNDDFENNQGIAECYLFLKQYANAVHYFDIAIIKVEELEKQDAWLKNTAGKDAITMASMGYNFGATKARALNNQAICYYNLQNFEAAINCATKGIASKNDYHNNYFIRGCVQLQLGNIEKAKQDLQKADNLGNPNAKKILSEAFN